MSLSVREIGLVAHDGVDAVGVGCVRQRQEAFLQLGKGLSVGDVVNEDDRGRTSAVHRAQPMELFATGGVPYGDVVGPPLFEVKSPSDSADGVFKLPLGVPVEQRRLPDVHVSQENHLDVGLPHLGHLGHDVARCRISLWPAEEEED